MPKTLLLADDSVTIQKVVGISFANEDVILLTVDNGDDAIHKAREVRPDLVLADVVMPGKNGYEVCATIKADPDIGSTPVMLLTGTFEAFDDARAQEVGADGHITKPFEAQALVDRVNALLSRSTSQGAASAPEAPAPLDNPFEDSNPPAEAFSTAPPPVPGAESGGFGDVPPPVSAAPQPPPIPESPMALESDGDFGNGPASEALTRSYDFFDDDFASSVNPPAATETDTSTSYGFGATTDGSLEPARAPIDPPSGFDFGEAQIGTPAFPAEEEAAPVSAAYDAPAFSAADRAPSFSAIEETGFAPTEAVADTAFAPTEAVADTAFAPTEAVADTALAPAEAAEVTPFAATEEASNFAAGDEHAAFLSGDTPDSIVQSPDSFSDALTVPPSFDSDIDDPLEDDAIDATRAWESPPVHAAAASHFGDEELETTALDEDAGQAAEPFEQAEAVLEEPSVAAVEEAPAVLAYDLPLSDASEDNSDFAFAGMDATGSGAAITGMDDAIAAPFDDAAAGGDDAFGSLMSESQRGESYANPPDSGPFDVSSTDLDSDGATSFGELSFTPAEPSFGSPETTGSATLPIAEAEFVGSPPQGGTDASAVTRDPSFRQDLHDAIEKIAWEAMGPVAEALVRECVDKVERVAWEVIPEMAEKLIREEIRKLKGEG